MQHIFSFAKFRTTVLNTFGVGLALTLFACSVHAKPNDLDLSGGRSWLNVARPLTAEDFRGRVVLLDFWTFCCINCMHVIPDLKYLEERFGDRLAVIGVHSAKFSNEQASENIRNAILRYEVHHAVLNDADFTVWKRYGVSAWPTFLLFSPDGELALTLSGEGQRAKLERAISGLIEKSPKKELPALPLKAEAGAPGILSFPGKVLADDANNRLIISNSSAHSILEVDQSGQVLNQIGAGVPGFRDGSYSEAQFARPQGLALSGDLLYVADTENNAIRVVDLKQQLITTLVSQGISSPWDLVIDGERLLVAMAGNHQIWEANRLSGAASVLIGSGREDLIDGDFFDAALAQPSGLALVGRKLYIADSEVSAVREADLDTKLVRTLIGRGLFNFGDKDGEFSQASLQHPLGVGLRAGKLIVADSYNHKLKELDLVTRKISSIAGSGKPDQLSEPGGIAISRRGIFIADTNNNRVRLLSGDGRLETLPITKPQALQDLVSDDLPNLERIKHPEIIFRRTPSSKLQLNFKLPEGYHVNQEAPSQLTLWRGNSKKQNLLVRNASFEINIPDTSGDLQIIATVYFCPITDGSTCEIKSFHYSAPMREDSRAAENVPIDLKLNKLQP